MGHLFIPLFECCNQEYKAYLQHRCENREFSMKYIRFYGEQKFYGAERRNPSLTPKHTHGTLNLLKS